MWQCELCTQHIGFSEKSGLSFLPLPLGPVCIQSFVGLFCHLDSWKYFLTLPQSLLSKIERGRKNWPSKRLHISHLVYIWRFAPAQLEQWQIMKTAVMNKEPKLLRMLLSSNRHLCNCTCRLWRQHWSVAVQGLSSWLCQCQLLWGCTLNRIREMFCIKTTSSLLSWNADPFLALTPNIALRSLVSTAERTICCAAGMNPSSLCAKLPPKALSAESLQAELRVWSLSTISSTNLTRCLGKERYVSCSEPVLGRFVSFVGLWDEFVVVFCSVLVLVVLWKEFVLIGSCYMKESLFGLLFSKPYLQFVSSGLFSVCFLSFISYWIAIQLFKSQHTSDVFRWISCIYVFIHTRCCFSFFNQNLKTQPNKRTPPNETKATKCKETHKEIFESFICGSLLRDDWGGSNRKSRQTMVWRWTNWN